MTDSYGSNAPLQRRRRDRGQTLVEILVSIVLLGTAVGGTLTALRTTIISSESGAAQSKANAWLLAAEGALYRAPYAACDDPTMSDIVLEYDTAVGLAPPPADWSGGSADVTSVEMWSSGAANWEDTCSFGSTAAQLVTIIVTSPTGEVGKTIQVVKGG